MPFMCGKKNACSTCENPADGTVICIHICAYRIYSWRMNQIHVILISMFYYFNFNSFIHSFNFSKTFII